MMTQETLREAVARAIAETEGFDPAMDHIEGWYETADAAIATMLERLRTPSDNVIWAGIEAGDKCEQAMRDREESDNPEDMPDYDEGDVVKFILQAMLAAFQQENSDG